MNDTIPFPSPESLPDLASHGLVSHHTPRATTQAPCPAPAPGDDPVAFWIRIRDFLPENLTGYTALDLGCGQGVIATELARRGAEVDIVDPDAASLRKTAEAVGASKLAHRIRLYQAGPYDLARVDRRYDIVLFVDVLRRLRYPMLALDIAASLARRCLVFAGSALPGDAREFPPQDLPFGARDRLLQPGWPHVAFIEHAFAGDRSTWWLPNRAATEAMLRSSGLGIMAHPAEDIYVCQPRAGAAAGVAAVRVAATGAAGAGLRPFEPAAESGEAAARVEPAA